MGAYLMMFASLATSLPLPIINLIAASYSSVYKSCKEAVGHFDMVAYFATNYGKTLERVEIQPTKPQFEGDLTSALFRPLEFPLLNATLDGTRDYWDQNLGEPRRAHCTNNAQMNMG